MRYVGLITVDLDVADDDEADGCMKKLVNILDVGAKRESLTCRPLLTQFSCQGAVLSAEPEVELSPDDDPESLFEEEK